MLYNMVDNKLLLLFTIVCYYADKGTSSVILLSRMSTAGICATPGSDFRLECTVVHDVEYIEEPKFFRIQNGIPDEVPIADSSKYRYTNNDSQCNVSPTQRCQTKASLYVFNASLDDAGQYYCTTTDVGEQRLIPLTTTTVWIQHDTRLRVTPNRTVLNINKNFSAEIHPYCDIGFLAVSVTFTDRSGTTVELGHQHRQSIDATPFVVWTGREFSIPKFECKYEGTYTVTLYAIRPQESQLVQTSEVVHVQACDGCCPGVTQSTEPSPSPSQAHLDGKTTTNGQYVERHLDNKDASVSKDGHNLFPVVLALAGVVVILLVVVFLLAYLYCRTRSRRYSQVQRHGTEDGKAVES